MHSHECNPNNTLIDEYRKTFESRISAGGTEKLPNSEESGANAVASSYDMEVHAKKSVGRHFELANKTIEQLKKISTHCLDDHQLKKEKLETVGDIVKSFSLRSSSNACTWHASADWTFCGP